jgi:hypothetical protein
MIPGKDPTQALGFSSAINGYEEKKKKRYEIECDDKSAQSDSSS